MSQNGYPFSLRGGWWHFVEALFRSEFLVVSFKAEFLILISLAILLHLGLLILLPESVTDLSQGAKR